MDNLFLLLFLASVVTLVIGLVKPSVFTRFLQERATRKGTAIIFGISTITFFVLFGITTEPTSQTQPVIQENRVSESAEVDKQTTELNNEQSQSQQQQEVANENNNIQEVETPKETKTTPDAEVPVPKTDRENMLVILKADASSKWGNDYGMVKYEYDNQVQAYDWVVAQTEYPDIMTKAKSKWSNDYGMVKYEYNNQVEAYKWISAQTEYLDIMTSAKQKWNDDYGMVKYEYNNQVEAYKSL
ncbi:hypothetical protein BMS3Abin15_01224 [bacterium BMS3Abin15]|nr:hypothetical protein BMS3Abin15_01224 [bacterium BMS3Abin15]